MPKLRFCEPVSGLYATRCKPQESAEPASTISELRLDLLFLPRHTGVMKKEKGFTLIEMLVAVALIVTLSATGLYGWRRWQQQQQLWQTARQVRDFLVVLRNDAWRHNRDHVVALKQDGQQWCLLKTDIPACQADSTFALIPLWPDIHITEITPALGFYGLRDTAWAGRIRLQSQAGEWLIIVSSWGRIRMCNGKGGFACQ